MPVKKQVPLTGSAASRAAPARPPADAAPAAPAGPTKVKLDISVATKINELNASGELGQDIRKPKVARLLSQIDPKQAVEVLEGVWSTEASIQDPNAFINNVCSIFIEAAAAEAAAAEEEAWDEGAEEEAWDEGAGEEYQEEGADAEVAAPAPKRQKVASAYEDKLSPAVAKEVARLSQVLAEPIELRHVGESLAKLSADDAISVLGKLEKNAAKVDNPTVWLIQHLATSAQASVKGKGKQALPGDWWCPSCGAHNFASRTACCKCHAAKPYRRADARAAARLLGAFAEVASHRGSAISRFGAAMAKALEALRAPASGGGGEAGGCGGAPPTAGEPSTAVTEAAMQAEAETDEPMDGNELDVIREARGAVRCPAEGQVTSTGGEDACRKGGEGTAAVPLDGSAAGAEGAAPGPLRGMTAQPLAAAASWAGSAERDRLLGDMEVFRGPRRAALQTGPKIDWGAVAESVQPTPTGTATGSIPPTGENSPQQ
ncbi:unnamed protein product [Prorocentrum cordatum]|uniref:RanBP2-type domain-containing protein n=1 Tax=Prorocentrum cordatum TaxID=2364126 RepID=A0ABN9XJX7_9DINO|nr:unnamed protein product [Polarella glacialis]